MCCAGRREPPVGRTAEATSGRRRHAERTGSFSGTTHGRSRRREIDSGLAAASMRSRSRPQFLVIRTAAAAISHEITPGTAVLRCSPGSLVRPDKRSASHAPFGAKTYRSSMSRMSDIAGESFLRNRPGRGRPDSSTPMSTLSPRNTGRGGTDTPPSPSPGGLHAPIHLVTRRRQNLPVHRDEPDAGLPRAGVKGTVHVTKPQPRLCSFG
jgi:hypothetical protein